jgi:hypothetical protein
MELDVKEVSGSAWMTLLPLVSRHDVWLLVRALALEPVAFLILLRVERAMAIGGWFDDSVLLMVDVVVSTVRYKSHGV